jgi:hypothetical protein
MKGNQCDNCRKFSKHEAGWLAIIQYTQSDGWTPFGSVSYQTEGTFCSMKCLAELAYTYVVINDKPQASPAD